MEDHIVFHRDSVVLDLLDQRKLPASEERFLCRTTADVITALQIMDVRGATALGVVRAAFENRKNIRVIADETRPFLQGARLTAWELQRDGIPVTVACDNACASLMSRGFVSLCVVGADRIAANGDTANKIGTLGVAILARHYGIPFYVLGPTTTIDLDTPTGADIPIEERDPGEIRTLWYAKTMAPDCKCFNPAFDVTDHTLIAGIVTEKGIARPPYTQSLPALFEKTEK